MTRLAAGGRSARRSRRSALVRHHRWAGRLLHAADGRGRDEPRQTVGTPQSADGALGERRRRRRRGRRAPTQRSSARACAYRRERRDRELLGLERQARDLREERVRVSAQADRRAELMRELEEIKRGDAAAAAEAARLGGARAAAAAASARSSASARRRTRRARPRRSATTPCATCRETLTRSSPQAPHPDRRVGKRALRETAEMRALGEKISTCESAGDARGARRGARARAFP